MAASYGCSALGPRTDAPLGTIPLSTSGNRRPLARSRVPVDRAPGPRDLGIHRRHQPHRQRHRSRPSAEYRAGDPRTRVVRRIWGSPSAVAGVLPASRP